ncbi:hypothetical protein BP6252_02869 [Coleophoma cylindrospora]|uniref:DUF7779 domain-containing protein n=1 Tax=Coleophoma cylindrospora TaxID=1849047 RepID=A0A3D8SG11_9HELO|nr:hypothetical protein BP6252_02869 [Coleophoma cylindrospora]
MDKLPKPLVVRVRGIQTANHAEAEQIVRDTIARRCGTETPTFKIVVVPSCDDSKTCDALLDFAAEQPFPRFLSRLQKRPLASVPIACDETDDDYLTFDCHFHGFTQLYPVSSGCTAAADIIAITGLDGHAYGSWRAKDEPWRMWLHHFLSRDLPSCRTMIYGYNSKLSSHGIDNIMDYGREFLEALKRARSSKGLRERPLIFIAHSFGGIILAHCLIKAVQTNESDHPTIAALYKATYGILFFGTPHKGLVVDDIRRMIQDAERHPRQSLLEEISTKSDLLSYQLADFKNLIRDRKIVSFYEMQQTRRLEKNPETQSWARTGSFMTAVEAGSALLELPDSMEIKCAVNADHSHMVKFDSRTSETYRQALGYLTEFQANAGRVVSQRFNSRPNLKYPSSTVPFAQEPAFVERQNGHGHDILHHLESHLCQFIFHTRIALAGLGGVGKSQIAIEYSYRLRAKDPSIWVFWVYAASFDRIEQCFRSIAVVLAVPGCDDPKADIFALVSRWLKDAGNGKWLMILDNADDINVFRQTLSRQDVSPSQENSVLDCIPQVTHGAVLITSRDTRVAYQLCGSHDKIIHVGPMNDVESLDMLKLRLPREQDHAGMKALSQALDRIPLAMSQAAAYISIGAPRMTVAKYLEMYRRDENDQSRLLDKDNGELRRDPGVPNSVIRTWQISFDHIRSMSAQASQLLSLMAVLDRQGIPELLFTQDKASPLDFEDAVAILTDFSLILTERTNSTFEMHRLVQLATRNWLELSGQLGQYRGQAIVMLSKAMPTGKYENWETCQLLSPHANEVLQYESSLELEPLALAALLHCLSWYNAEQGHYSAASSQGLISVSLREKVLGKEHPDTLNSISNLALTYSDQGQYQKAEQLGVEVLKKRKGVLGEEHPDTLTSISNLVSIYTYQGQYDKAEKLGEEVIKKRTKLLGEKHPNTLTSISNLVSIYLNQGQYDKAEQLGEEVTKKRTEVLGEEHPDTLRSISILVSTYLNQGQYDKAEKLGEELIKKQIKLLGEEHPDTLISISNLVSIYTCQGQHDKAEQLGEEVIEKRSKVLGDEHPNTLISKSHLVSIYLYQCQYDKAEQLGAEVMQKRAKVLGEEHPGTLTSMKNLAYIWHCQGRHAEALQLMKNCASASATVLGLEHPHTKTRYQTLLDWQDKPSIASTSMNLNVQSAAELSQADLQTSEEDLRQANHGSGQSPGNATVPGRTSGGTPRGFRQRMKRMVNRQ